MKNVYLGLSTILFATLAACGNDANDLPVDAAVVNPTVDAPTQVNTNVDVPAGDISVDTTWTADKVYTLKGQVFVTAGTLTIQPGTVIKGEAGSVLVITTGAKLHAVGTATAPIVFTSSKATPVSGDWGGVVLLGKAAVNVTGGINKVEGFPTSLGAKIEYGAATADDAHDCGKLKYARIEYAGFELSTDNELNGLTVGACGTATDIDYVQVHLGLDDGIEVFGGTNTLKHIVVSQADDDSLDWDLGWTGKAQFVIVQQKLGRGNMAIEADSNRNNNDALPRSAPQIWNATFIGGDGATADKQGGLHLRRGSAGKFGNMIIAYFSTMAVDIDGAASVMQANTGGITFEHTYFVKPAAADLWPLNFDVAGNPAVANDCVNSVCFDEAAVFSSVTSNKINIDPMLVAPKNTTAPNFMLAPASPARTCGTPPAGFDQTATFCGAMGDTDWTAGWTRFPA